MSFLSAQLKMRISVIIPDDLLGQHTIVSSPVFTLLRTTAKPDYLRIGLGTVPFLKLVHKIIISLVDVPISGTLPLVCFRMGVSCVFALT